jgi:hypothetical protein
MFYLLAYILVEYFVFLNLFVAVLVDNFHLAIEAQNQLNEEEEEERERAVYLSAPSGEFSHLCNVQIQTVLPIFYLHLAFARVVKVILQRKFTIIHSFN